MCITRSESTRAGAFVNVDSKELACNTYVKNAVSPSIAANKILRRSQPSPESKNASRYAGAAGSVGGITQQVWYARSIFLSRKKEANL